MGMNLLSLPSCIWRNITSCCLPPLGDQTAGSLSESYTPSAQQHGRGMDEVFFPHSSGFLLNLLPSRSWQGLRVPRRAFSRSTSIQTISMPTKRQCQRLPLWWILQQRRLVLKQVDTALLLWKKLEGFTVRPGIMSKKKAYAFSFFCSPLPGAEANLPICLQDRLCRRLTAPATSQ